MARAGTGSIPPAADANTPGATAAQDTNASDDPLRGKPLVFPRTNVNLCMFQQFSVFRNWWVQAERLQELGFSARVCVSFCRRAVVTRELGRRTEAPITTLAKQLWRSIAINHGHHVQGTPPPLRLTSLGEACFQQCYHEIADFESAGGLGSALESLLGKFEYWGGQQSQG